MIITDEAISVDEVFSWLIAVPKRIPGAIIIVLDHWILDAIFIQCHLDVVSFLFEIKFRGVDADDGQTCIPLFFIPCRQIG